MTSLESYRDPFDAIKDFQNLLQEFTGAPYAIVTDCCTHAMEIALRINRPKSEVIFPGRTYLSVVMLMHKLDLQYQLTDESWTGYYRLQNTDIWDCARFLEPKMYQSGTVQCLSFNRGKPLSIGKGGAILTDDAEIASRANRMRYDGRDIFRHRQWADQQNFEIGFHYYMRPEECVVGINLLSQGQLRPQTADMFVYPDCRTVNIR